MKIRYMGYFKIYNQLRWPGSTLLNSTWLMQIEKNNISFIYKQFSLCRLSDSTSDGTWLRRWRGSVDQEPRPFMSITSSLRLWPAGIRTQLSPSLPTGPCPGWAAVCQLYRTLEAGIGPGKNDPIGAQLRGLPCNILCHTVSWEVRRWSTLCRTHTYRVKLYQWNSVIKLTGIQDTGGAQDIMPCLSSHPPIELWHYPYSEVWWW